MKKGWVKLIAASALMLVGLAGCGPSSSGSSSSSKSDSKSGGSLLVWEDKDKSDGIKAAVKEFEKENNVKIKIVEKTYADQLKQLRLDGPAGTGPDVITIPGDQIGTAVTEGLLKELKVSKATQSIYTDSAMESQTVDGKVYGLPKAVESTVLFYNKKIVSEKDLPQTTEEWYTFSKEQRAKGKYGLLALWDQIYYAQGVFSGYGGYIFGQKSNGAYDATDIGLNNKGAVEAATYISKFYKDGLFPKGILGDKGINVLDSLFTEGKAAAVISGPWNFEPYKKAGIDYGVTQLPKLANGKQMSSFIGVKSYNVSTYSKNATVAEKFVKFLADKKNSKKRYEITGEVPAIKSLVDSSAVKNDANAEAVAKQSQSAELTPNITEMDQVWTPINNALQVIATDKATPKSALDSAVSQINSAIKANGKK
ncbi:extracellular solute-binding protein [Lapidilactobacillus mulanensis]|uniref:Extracellular solute-binding protein n=1 Tax=Lapidilactobacillus mulanensis TaxID=2485999 RepID=A0ABW4DPV5_9LACO|nr:extracellular solute-binding protein [Lapidilactobacillus mulanensis]